MEAYYGLIALFMVSVNGRFLRAMQLFSDKYVNDEVSIFWFIQPFVLPMAALVGLAVLVFFKTDILAWIALSGLAFEIVCAVYRNKARKKLSPPVS